MPGFLGFLLVLAASLVTPQDPRQIPSARDSPNPTCGPSVSRLGTGPTRGGGGRGLSTSSRHAAPAPLTPHSQPHPGEGRLAAVGRRAGLGEAGCLMKY